MLEFLPDGAGRANGARGAGGLRLDTVVTGYVIRDKIRKRAVRPPGRFGAGLRAGRGGGQGGGEGGERRVVEVVRGPVGKRRSIMTTVPAHGDLSPRARIYFFVFVVHTMDTMAGAMQFSRG